MVENYITEILHFHCTQIDLSGPCILHGSVANTGPLTVCSEIFPSQAVRSLLVVVSSLAHLLVESWTFPFKGWNCGVSSVISSMFSSSLSWFLPMDFQVFVSHSHPHFFSTFLPSARETSYVFSHNKGYVPDTTACSFIHPCCIQGL